MNRKGALLAAPLILGLALAPVPTASSATTQLTGYAATAVADGGRLSFKVPAFAIVEDVFDGGGPVSQTVMDSQGANSFAALPYPGDTVIAGPGLFAVATGQQLPGGYPFYVAASHPTTPSQELKDPTGTYALNAASGASEGSSSAQARIRPALGDAAGAGGAQAVTHTLIDGDTLTADAATVNEALSFGGGALRIASIRSRSTTTYVAASGERTTTTALTVEGGSAGGYSFAYGPGGVTVASRAQVPVPVSSGIDAVNQALAPAGISLRFVGAQPLSGGAAADSFEVTMQRGPSNGFPGSIVRLRFGGATTAVDVSGVQRPVTDALPPVPSNSDTSSGPTASEVNEVAPTAGEPPVSDTVAAATVTPGGAPDEAAPADIDESAGAPAVSAAPPPAVLFAQPVARGHLRLGRWNSAGSFYLTLAAAGIFIIALGLLWRRKGVLRP